jgi:WD40 repeat protein/predicted Ser/Thr protein kinase
MPATQSVCLGDFEVIEEIGRGGMGIVYRARQKSVGRMVAVKILHPGRMLSAGEVERFRQEAETVARLEHPNVVPVYDAGEDAGQPWCAMKLVQGGTLANTASQNSALPRNEDRFATIAVLMSKIATAVHHAHQRGVLHRDLKPSNILLDEAGQPYVTDFGLARVLDQDSALTRTGAFFGSPAYSAPEQAASDGRKVTTAADIYGLGAILYELLTGRPPFTGATPVETLRRVLESEPTKPHLIRNEVPLDLETICLKCLEKEPSRRYSSAQVLADDLGHFLSEEPVQARPVSPVERGWRWCRRKPVLASLIVTVLALVVLVLIGAPVAVVRINRALARAERNLYAADMRQASEALRNGDLDHVEELLESHRPRPGKEDLRGFEWRYLAHAADQSELVTHQLQGLGWSGSGFPCDLATAEGILYNFHRKTGEILAWNMTNWTLLPLKPPSTPGSRRWYQPWEEAPFVLDEQTGTVAVYRLPGFERKAVVPVPGKVLQAAVSTGWRMLAVAFEQGGVYRVLVWDLQANTQHFLASGYPRPVSWLGFSRDATVLGVACAGGEIGLWSVRDATALASPSLDVSSNNVTPFFDPGSTRLYLIRGRERKALEAWDWSTGQLTTPYQARLGQLETFAFSPDNSTLAAAGSDGVIALVDAKELRQLRVMSASNSKIRSLAFSPSGRLMASGSQDRCVRLWDINTFRELQTLGGNSDQVLRVAFTPDEESVVALLLDGTIRVWGLEAVLNRNVIWRKTNSFESFALSADEKAIAASDSLGYVHVFDRASGTEIRALQSGNRAVVAFSFSPTEHLLAWAGPTTLGLLNYDSGQTNFVPLPGSGDPYCNPEFSPNGRQMVFADSNHIHLMEVSTRTSHPFASIDSPAMGLAVSPDGRSLASTHWDGTVKLWDLASRRQIAKEIVNTGFAFDVQFSADDRLLATSGSVATGKLWDVLPSGLKLRHTLRGHVGWVGIQFSPDSHRVISSSDEDALKIWDTQTGLEVGAIFGHWGGLAVGFCFSHDGNALYALGKDGEFRRWKAPSLDQLAARTSKSHPP